MSGYRVEPEYERNIRLLKEVATGIWDGIVRSFTGPASADPIDYYVPPSEDSTTVKVAKGAGAAAGTFLMGCGGGGHVEDTLPPGGPDGMIYVDDDTADDDTGDDDVVDDDVVDDDTGDDDVVVDDDTGDDDIVADDDSSTDDDTTPITEIELGMQFCAGDGLLGSAADISAITGCMAMTAFTLNDSEAVATIGDFLNPENVMNMELMIETAASVPAVAGLSLDIEPIRDDFEYDGETGLYMEGSWILRDGENEYGYLFAERWAAFVTLQFNAEYEGTPYSLLYRNPCPSDGPECVFILASGDLGGAE